MDVSLLLQSQFIKAAEFNGKDVTYTISKVTLEELEDTKGGKKVKGLVHFNDLKKQWVLNRTNVEALKAMWGRETDHWLGKRVTLWPMPMQDPQTGEAIEAVRVRGSPDLQKDMTFELKLPRKRPVTVQLRRTGGNGKVNGAAPNGNGKPAAKTETPFDRLTRMAEEKGHEWPAVKEGLGKLYPGRTKRSDVTDEIADKILAWLNPEPPPAKPGADDDDEMPA